MGEIWCCIMALLCLLYGTLVLVLMLLLLLLLLFVLLEVRLR